MGMRTTKGLINSLFVFLLILVVFAGCARPVALTRLVDTPPAVSAATIPISANNTGAGDALAILRDHAASLGSGSFLDTTTWKAQRDALVSASDEAIRDVNTGEYIAAADILKNRFKDAGDKQILSQDQRKLSQLTDVALDCIANAAKTTVDTKYGEVAGAVGLVESWTWKGLPYAKPPVGELRWRAPQAPDPWTGVRQSSDSFEIAVQPAVSKS
jgi:para-nitrobenzyl esterase